MVLRRRRKTQHSMGASIGDTLLQGSQPLLPPMAAPFSPLPLRFSRSTFGSASPVAVVAPRRRIESVEVEEEIEEVEVQRQTTSPKQIRDNDNDVDEDNDNDGPAFPASVSASIDTIEIIVPAPSPFQDPAEPR